MLKRKILLAMLLLGCTSSQPPTTTARPDRVIATDERTGVTMRSPNDPGPAPVEIRASQDSVMRAVELTYLFLKVPITHLDRALGEQGNKMFTMSRTFDGRNISNFLNCGDDPFRGPNADYNRITASLVTRTRPLAANRTAVEAASPGYFPKPGSGGAIFCAPTGSLELHLAEMIASRVTQQ